MIVQHTCFSFSMPGWSNQCFRDRGTVSLHFEPSCALLRMNRLCLLSISGPQYSRAGPYGYVTMADDKVGLRAGNNLRRWPP